MSEGESGIFYRSWQKDICPRTIALPLKECSLGTYIYPSGEVED